MSRGAVYAVAAVVAAALSAFGAIARPGGDDTVAALDGASLFQAKGCATCHDGPDGPSLIGVGPSLAEAPTWAADRVDRMSAEEYVEQSMRNPAAFISPLWSGPNGPSDGMPLLQLSDGEIAALVDYVLQRDEDR